jgi:Omp85 superfamily domain
MLAIGWTLIAGLATPATAQSTAPETNRAVSLYGVVPRETSGVEGTAATDQATPAAVDRKAPAKRGEFVAAPLPMINPTLENGLAFVAGYLYRLDVRDTETPPSVTGVGGFKTSNGSWAAAFVQSLHPAHDKFRILGLAAYSDVNYAFYGIGQSAGDAGVSIELNQVGPVGLVDGLIRVYPQWYVGARYQLLNMTVAANSVTTPSDPAFPVQDANLRTAALGPRVEFDSRDNPFYPRSGLHMQGIASFYGQAVGGRRTYQVYQGWINGYRAIGSRHVLAWHAGGCGADGSVAFYDLCLLGKNQDLRGYPTGQYRDRAMIAVQAEWRAELWWRFGAAAFVGGGEVSPDFGSVSAKDVLPGGGVGLRFTLAKRNHVNLRVDYAWGKSSTALYVGVAEAF